jgi:hypothetical protein
VRAVVDFAREDLPLAGAARAVAAAVGQHQVGAHRGRQHGLAVVACERVIAGLYGNLERHGTNSVALESRREGAIHSGKA